MNIDDVNEIQITVEIARHYFDLFVGDWASAKLVAEDQEILFEIILDAYYFIDKNVHTKNGGPQVADRNATVTYLQQYLKSRKDPDSKQSPGGGHESAAANMGVA